MKKCVIHGLDPEGQKKTHVFKDQSSKMRHFSSQFLVCSVGVEYGFYSFRVMVCQV